MGKVIKVGQLQIGRGQRCFITAEIGINHNGDIELAKRMVTKAKQCGADAVKFQYYRTEDFLNDRKSKYTYTSGGKKVVECQFDMFKRCELSFQQIGELKRYCDKAGIIFFATPSGEKGVCELQELGVELLKNSSDNITNFSLIECMAKTGIPLVISTGMSTASEIEDAVKVVEEAGGKELIILHCVSLYPTPAAEVNLLKIPALMAKFDYPIGFSDHSEGHIAAVGAVALGASFVEKHFTVDKSLPGPDQQVSADPQEFSTLVSSIRQMESCLGQGGAELSVAEEQARKQYRLSCVAACDIREGEILSKDNLCLSRPGTGVDASQLSSLLGKRAKRFLSEKTFIKFSDVS
jgi:N,N'-diacetyllegionaminate synthase